MLWKTRRSVTSWWVATTSTCRPSTIPQLPGEMSFCVLPRHLTIHLRWWNTLWVSESGVRVTVARYTFSANVKWSLNLIFSDFPLQRGWCTHGRRWAWSWSPTPRLSAPSASSRCTLSWWVSAKSLTSAVSATLYQPARSTAHLGWLEMAQPLNIHSSVTVRVH